MVDGDALRKNWSTGLLRSIKDLPDPDVAFRLILRTAFYRSSAFGHLLSQRFKK
jgi:hypothetical protein